MVTLDMGMAYLVPGILIPQVEYVITGTSGGHSAMSQLVKSERVRE
jgi:hypothetical protein